jgi:peptide-N4-(N-acetyl-beta-glucosaminyl)asparagine amidase
MSYCIAFSIEGATDVTRRYVRNATAHGADRNRAPEEVLMWITNEIRRMRRENLSKEEKRRIIAEDAREEKELRGYVVQSLAAEIGKLLPPRPGSGGEEQKIPAQRDAATSWQQASGEEASTPRTPTPSRPPREGH